MISAILYNCIAYSHQCVINNAFIIPLDTAMHTWSIFFARVNSDLYIIIDMFESD